MESIHNRMEYKMTRYLGTYINYSTAVTKVLKVCLTFTRKHQQQTSHIIHGTILIINYI